MPPLDVNSMYKILSLNIHKRYTDVVKTTKRETFLISYKGHKAQGVQGVSTKK